MGDEENCAGQEALAHRSPGRWVRPAPALTISCAEQPFAFTDMGDADGDKREETRTLAEDDATDKSTIRSTEQQLEEADAGCTDSSAEHSGGRIFEADADLHTDKTEDDRTFAEEDVTNQSTSTESQLKDTLAPVPNQPWPLRDAVVNKGEVGAILDKSRITELVLELQAVMVETLQSLLSRLGRLRQPQLRPRCLRLRVTLSSVQ